MKISIKTFAALLISGCIVSCNNNDSSKSSSSSDSTTMKTAPAADTSASTTNSNTTMGAGGDQSIVNDMVDANTKEIAWLKAAISKGTNKDVKEHASMMLKDHEALAVKVKDLVAKKNMTAPPMPDVSNEVTINDKSGKDFDMAWSDKMVNDHQNLLDKLNKSEGDAKDADLKSLITNTKPIVQKHLDMAKLLKDKMK
jgi:putative membrane protein